MYLETPNSAAFNASAMGDRWIGWDPLRHLHVFDPSSLRTALRSSGWEVRSWATVPHSKVHRFERAYTLEERSGEVARERDSATPPVLARGAYLNGRRWAASIRRGGVGDNLAVWAERRVVAGDHT